MDAFIFEYAVSLRNTSLTEIMLWATLMGSYMVIPFASLWSMTVRKKLGGKGFYLPLVMLLVSLLLEAVIKNLVGKERPPVDLRLVNENNFSFPSGHAMNSTTAYGILAVELTKMWSRRKLEITAGIAGLVFLISISRVYLGVHYPSDIAGGWIAGGLLIGLYYRITSKAKEKEQTQKYKENRKDR